MKIFVVIETSGDEDAVFWNEGQLYNTIHGAFTSRKSAEKWIDNLTLEDGYINVSSSEIKDNERNYLLDTYRYMYNESEDDYKYYCIKETELISDNQSYEGLYSTNCNYELERQVN